MTDLHFSWQGTRLSFLWFATSSKFLQMDGNVIQLSVCTHTKEAILNNWLTVMLVCARFKVLLTKHLVLSWSRPQNLEEVQIYTWICILYRSGERTCLCLAFNPLIKGQWHILTKKTQFDSSPPRPPLICAFSALLSVLGSSCIHVELCAHFFSLW